MPRAMNSRRLPVLARAFVDDHPVALSLSSDGRLVAVVTGGGDLYVIASEDGRIVARVAAHANGASCVDFAPAADLLATGGHDGTARVFRPDGTLVAELPGGSAWVEDVAFAPVGGLLATAAGKRVRLWTSDGRPVLESAAHESTVTAIAWSRRGDELASACYGGVHLFPVAGGASRHLPFSGSLISLARRPDDRVIACGAQDGSVHFWRLPSGEDAHMTGYPLKPRALAWDARGDLLATAGDVRASVWRFDGTGPEGTAPIQLARHEAPITALAFSPRKGVLASGGQDTGVVLWEPKRSNKPIAFAFMEDFVADLAWHPQHRFLVASDVAGNVRVFGPEAS
jgi:WD40 repeat protein